MNYEREPMVDIRERTLEYALRAVKLFRYLHKRRDPVSLILGRQYLRAASSIGANLVEAQSGESRRDFIHKCAIAQKEAREAKYWLILLLKSGSVPERRLADLFNETDQIIAILTKIIVNTKRNKTLS
jgi:four helix bundle protein